jgi:hypothetical protein
MQPTANNRGQQLDSKGWTTNVRQRSFSSGAEPDMDRDVAGSSALQRNNTTGRSFSQSLRRRFGSFRRSMGAGEVGY